MDDATQSRGSYDANALRTLLLRDRELPSLLAASKELKTARTGLEEPGVTAILDDWEKVAPDGDDTKELQRLLAKAHIRGLLTAYDGVERERSSLRRGPVAHIIPPMTNGQPGDDMNGVPLKLVGLNKVGNEPLGLMLREDAGEVKISRIMVGMSADRQGLLHVGDVVYEVNGKVVNGDVELVQRELKQAKGTIQMKVIPTYLDQLPVSQVYMRAHFDYDPSQDPEFNGPDGGLAFKRGDVLLILKPDDQDWWQAKIEGGSENPGFIPSLVLQERREAQKRDPGLPQGPRGGCLGWRKKKTKPVMYSAKNHADFDRHELNIYEEVARIAPGQRKTVVLIGAQGVGRRGLKQRLILSSADRYSTTLPHTTRPILEGEEDGKHYWFTSDESMMADIAAYKFIEHGTYEGHLYGTKIDSVRAVIRSGKICMLDVNPQALKRLRTSEFKPYVIFIKAPSFAVLKRMHQEAARTSAAMDVGAYSDEDLQRTLHESEQIEESYRHFFDKIIVNEGIEETYRKLMQTMQELEVSPQWVPINWVF